MNKASKKLRELIALKKLTQDVLAWRAGVSIRTVSRILSGTGKANRSTRKLIAEALKCSVSDIWGESYEDSRG